MELEQKKLYLDQYQTLKSQCQCLEEEWKILQKEEECYPNMLWKGKEEKFEQWEKEFTALKQQIINQRYERIRIYREIRREIEAMENETEREVLTYRYLCGFTWEEIAERMHYSFQHIHRIHKKALTNFRHVIECDT